MKNARRMCPQDVLASNTLVCYTALPLMMIIVRDKMDTTFQDIVSKIQISI